MRKQNQKDRAKYNHEINESKLRVLTQSITLKAWKIFLQCRSQIDI